MYPDFIKDAEAEAENKRALRSFKFALEVEQQHEALYQEALDGLEAEQDEDFDYYVCPVCGSTHPRQAPDRCPVCGLSGEKFLKVD